MSEAEGCVTMVKRREPRRARQSYRVADDGPTIREGLPYPVVHYPGSSGVFFAFSREESAPAVLCACTRPAVEHAVRLRAQVAERQGYVLDAGDLLDESLFPKRFLEEVRAPPLCYGGDDPLASIQFERGLCHRCNLAAPTLRYCDDVEGGRFIQYYGWYVGQAYLRFGIQPGSLEHLPDVCPGELAPYVTAVDMAAASLRVAEEIAAQQAQVEERRDPFVAARQRFATRMYRRACRSLDKQIENQVRAEFGFKPVGQEWISEAMLYRIVCQVFPDQQVLRRDHPEWLGGLELDVYVPDLELAFEYQGQPHFHAIPAWGGEEAVHEVQERDARKAGLCAGHGVTLIAVDYTEPLTETYVRGLLNVGQD
jgi:hypothetical protein